MFFKYILKNNIKLSYNVTSIITCIIQIILMFSDVYVNIRKYFNI